MKMILVRHGKTEENLKGIIAGSLPGTLSPLGILQAKNTAKKLRNWNIESVYSSDSARAADTARFIVRFHRNIPLRFTKALRECNFRQFQGTRINPKMENGFDTSYCENKFGKYGVETPSAYYKRVKKFLLSIYKDDDRTVLIVSHSITIRFLVTVIMNKSPRYSARVRTIQNDEVPVFEVEKNGGFHSKLIETESVLRKPIL